MLRAYIDNVASKYKPQNSDETRWKSPRRVIRTSKIPLMEKLALMCESQQVIQC